MNNEKKSIKMPNQLDPYEGCKNQKHERVDKSIDSLCLVLAALELLSARVSAEPVKAQEDNVWNTCSLEDHLNTAPGRIDHFVSAAQSVIDQIEEKLFLMLICYRCLTVNRPDQLRPSKKFKRLSVEASARIKCCRKCNCIWFI